MIGAAMTEPRTEAGRRLLDTWFPSRPYESPVLAGMTSAIADIEREAVLAERARILAELRQAAERALLIDVDEAIAIVKGEQG